MGRSLPGARLQVSLLESKPHRLPLLSVELSIVTPLFGGGVATGQVGDLLPVRGSSVRGHLRFWWRACNATRYRDAAELFQAESAIWGKTQVGGQVGPASAAIEVHVSLLDVGQSVPCATYEQRPGGRPRLSWRPGYPPYALFPFQGKPGNAQEAQEPPAEAREGVRFRLDLAMSPYAGPARRAELEQAARDAVWAWVTFGGIGARTRRGCGSLWCDRILHPADEPTGWLRPDGDLTKWLRETARRRVHQASLASSLQLPVLWGAHFVLGVNRGSPLAAWTTAVEAMRDLRQRPGIGRATSQDRGRPGRSLWPEADSLRAAFGAARIDGRQPIHPARPFFPRADFGLPIVFHFKLDHPPSDETLDDFILEPALEGASRMASPIILKPLMVSRDQAVPMALELNAPTVAGARCGGRSVPMVVRATEGQPVGVSPGDLANIAKAQQVQPLQPASQNARRAFMAFVARRWSAKEVSL